MESEIYKGYSVWGHAILQQEGILQPERYAASGTITLGGKLIEASPSIRPIQFFSRVLLGCFPLQPLLATHILPDAATIAPGAILPVPDRGVDKPDAAGRGTCCANRVAILAGIEGWLASFTSSDCLVNRLVSESRAQLGHKGSHLRHWMTRPANACIHG